MNFVFRFHITLKNGFEFRFSMACYLKNRSEFRVLLLHDSSKTDHCTSHLKSPDTPLGVYRGIHFLCKGKQLNFLLPGAKVSGELPRPHDMSPTHGTPF